MNRGGASGIEATVVMTPGLCHSEGSAICFLWATVVVVGADLVAWVRGGELSWVAAGERVVMF